MKCERCWSEDEVDAHCAPTGPHDSIALCRACRAVAPENPVLFEKMFLQFATRKELMRHFDAEEEAEALRKWCTDVGMEIGKLGATLAQESTDMGLLSSPSPFAGETPSQTPYGYASKGKGLVPSPIEAEVIRSVFDLYLRGKSLQEIRQLLNNAQVPSPRGGGWHRSTIRYILRNPLYAGSRRWRGVLREDSHRAIIDPDHFNQVQMMLSQRCRRPEQRGVGAAQLRVV